MHSCIVLDPLCIQEKFMVLVPLSGGAGLHLSVDEKRKFVMIHNRHSRGTMKVHVCALTIMHARDVSTGCVCTPPFGKEGGTRCALTIMHGM